MKTILVVLLLISTGAIAQEYFPNPYDERYFDQQQRIDEQRQLQQEFLNQQFINQQHLLNLQQWQREKEIRELKEKW